MNHETIAFFFDSWGRAHVPCDPNMTGAGAFGPTGASVPAYHLPSWAEAEERGLLVRSASDGFGWDYVPKNPKRRLRVIYR